MPTVLLTVVVIIIQLVKREWDDVTSVKTGQKENFASHANLEVTVMPQRDKDVADVIAMITATKPVVFVTWLQENAYARTTPRVLTASDVSLNFMEIPDTAADVIISVNLEEC